MAKKLIGLFNVRDILGDDKKIEEFSNQIAELVNQEIKKAEAENKNQNLPAYLKGLKEGEDYEWVDMTDYFDVVNGKKEYDENEP